jgi:hypothetical protein
MVRPCPHSLAQCFQAPFDQSRSRGWATAKAISDVIDRATLKVPETNRLALHFRERGDHLRQPQCSLATDDPLASVCRKKALFADDRPAAAGTPGRKCVATGISEALNRPAHAAVAHVSTCFGM